MRNPLAERVELSARMGFVSSDPAVTPRATLTLTGGEELLGDLSPTSPAPLCPTSMKPAANPEINNMGEDQNCKPKS